MKNKNCGFTIIELLIATAVFSAVLLISLTGFLQLSRLFYKGVSLTQTQQTAQEIVEDVSTALQFAPSAVLDCVNASPSCNYYCIGGVRYTFNLSQQVDLANAPAADSGGLIRDKLPGATACAPPLGPGNVPLKSPKELLGGKMRLAKFTVCVVDYNCPGSGPPPATAPQSLLYAIDVKIAYGDDESLESPDTEAVTCNSNLRISQFCSVIQQTTTVSQGF